MKFCFAFILLSFAALNAQDAASVLNRYVQVTGGVELYKRYNSLHLFYAITHPDKTTENVDYFHTRDGKTLTETDTGTSTRDAGLSEGVVWKYSEAKGAQILSGKQAARFLADSKGFDEDDWHIRYPTVALLTNQVVNGSPCRHLKLTRTDGSTLERFYDVKSGLLVRQVSTEFDDAGIEQPTTTDYVRYDTFFGIRRPVEWRIQSGTQTYSVETNTVTYSPTAEATNFEIPHDVVRAIVASRNKSSTLPNPVDLIDKFVAATGGKKVYEGIKTETVQAEVAFTDQNLKFPVVTYSAGNKQYSSFDIPSMGKFETGDDGFTAWEKSVVMGPKLRPHSAGSDFIGPEPDQVLRWSDSALQMETMAQEQVNGTPCYLVRMGPQSPAASTACFDTKTGLLLKTVYPEGDDGTAEQIYSDYRDVSGLLVCHRIETKVAGHGATVQINEIAINASIPPGVFDLPPDVRALKARRDAAAQKVPAAPGAPTLKRPAIPQ
jgi:hypothetical protein